MFNKFLLLVIGAQAIQRHHHHHHPMGVTLLQDDPRCSSQGCFNNDAHYADEGELGFPNGYTVQNYGNVDSDIANSINHMEALEKKFGNKDWIPEEPAAIARDYPVPNFGMDKEIVSGLENLTVAEGIVKHKWVWDGASYKNPARHNPVTPFYDEDSTLEHDIKVSQKN